MALMLLDLGLVALDVAAYVQTRVVDVSLVTSFLSFHKKKSFLLSVTSYSFSYETAIL